MWGKFEQLTDRPVHHGWLCSRYKLTVRLSAPLWAASSEASLLAQVLHVRRCSQLRAGAAEGFGMGQLCRRHLLDVLGAADPLPATRGVRAHQIATDGQQIAQSAQSACPSIHRYSVQIVRIGKIKYSTVADWHGTFTTSCREARAILC